MPLLIFLKVHFQATCMPTTRVLVKHAKSQVPSKDLKTNKNLLIKSNVHTEKYTYYTWTPGWSLTSKLICETSTQINTQNIIDIPEAPPTPFQSLLVPQPTAILTSNARDQFHLGSFFFLSVLPINEITQYAVFCVWLLSPVLFVDSPILLHVVVDCWFSSAEWYSLVWWHRSAFIHSVKI